MSVCYMHPACHVTRVCCGAVVTVWLCVRVLSHDDLCVSGMVCEWDGVSVYVLFVSACCLVQRARVHE